MFKLEKLGRADIYQITFFALGIFVNYNKSRLPRILGFTPIHLQQASLLPKAADSLALAASAGDYSWDPLHSCLGPACPVILLALFTAMLGKQHHRL